MACEQVAGKKTRHIINSLQTSSRIVVHASGDQFRGEFHSLSRSDSTMNTVLEMMEIALVYNANEVEYSPTHLSDPNYIFFSDEVSFYSTDSSSIHHESWKKLLHCRWNCEADCLCVVGKCDSCCVPVVLVQCFQCFILKYTTLYVQHTLEDGYLVTHFRFAWKLLTHFSPLCWPSI